MKKNRFHGIVKATSNKGFGCKETRIHRTGSHIYTQGTMDTLFNSTEKNARGIPQAPFIENVKDIIKDPSDFELCFGKFQERLSKYKFMQESKMATVKQLQTRIPDLQNTLKICQSLRNHSEDGDEDAEPMLLHYQLNDTLFTKAQVDIPQDRGDLKVGLWLGADVMLEYPVDEAIELLQKKLTDSEESLAVSTEDVEFLRENITTMEVNCARLYNWDVQRRQELKQAEEGTKNLKI
ncbi:tubulin-binding prefolding complex subunit PAC10 [Saccharomyces eubayanus]|uniref:tubulin-binding prefolding complex subunit PAC10 n=1 Tax=Saccharomyces eubayanus TaxID=1080349 RepID=UPI0006C6DEB4|nr:PAC10-like protein [Saccharomyces eubayanus]KOG99570.1 PAC10-like protein [Saccharomyces eubayanus]